MKMTHISLKVKYNNLYGYSLLWKAWQAWHGSFFFAKLTTFYSIIVCLSTLGWIFFFFVLLQPLHATSGYTGIEFTATGSPSICFKKKIYFYNKRLLLTDHVFLVRSQDKRLFPIRDYIKEIIGIELLFAARKSN